MTEKTTSPAGPLMTGCINRLKTVLVFIAATAALSACASAPSKPADPPTPTDSFVALDQEATTLPETGATEVAVIVETKAATPEAKPSSGLLGFLRRNKAEPEPILLEAAPSELEVTETVSVDAGVTEAETSSALEDAPIQTLSDEEFAALGLVEPEKPEPAKRAGLFGFLRNREAASDPIPLPIEDPVRIGDVEGTLSEPISDTVEPPVLIAASAPEPEKRRGLGALFSMRAEAAAPNDTREPGAGVNGPLPFGEVIKVCGVRRSDMGTEVARSGGNGVYRLFDTEPTSTEQRSQFVTGFRDGCSRRMTGALALFGSFDVHEAKRYSKSNKTPYTAVDLAYEKVKSRVCGVGRGKHCPPNKAERLNREVTFVTVYRAFGSSGAWMELFLHNGELAAHSTVEK